MNKTQTNSNRWTIFSEPLKDDNSCLAIPASGNIDQILQFIKNFDPTYRLPKYQLNKIFTNEDDTLIIKLICDSKFRIKTVKYEKI